MKLISLCQKGLVSAYLGDVESAGRARLLVRHRPCKIDMATSVKKTVRSPISGAIIPNYDNEADVVAMGTNIVGNDVANTLHWSLRQSNSF